MNRTGVGAADRQTDSGSVRLLEVDPDLGAQLDDETVRTARAELVVPVARIEWTTRQGEWRPTEPPGQVLVLVIDGLILRELALAGTASAEVLGPGDVLRPWGLDAPGVMGLSERVSWTVLSPTSVAVLDMAFLRRAGRWPEVLAALLERGVTRAKSLALQHAITNAKHVETRLLVQFWQLAERWGRVGPHSVSLTLPVTHEMLAKLVGATRPSVSTALGRLAERELLVREAPGVWRLRRDVSVALGDLDGESEPTRRI